MALELEIVREEFDSKTKTRHVFFRVVEYDNNGSLVGEGEERSMAFVLGGFSDPAEMDKSLDDLKAKMVSRYNLQKVNAAALEGFLDAKAKRRPGVKPRVKS